MSEPLVNDLSLGLLVLTVILGVYLKYFSRPLPLVHPLLLGKQSEVSQTRHNGESGVYRSWATGHGSPLSLRPAKVLHTVANIVDMSCPTRYIYGTFISNDLLKLRAKNIAKGLVGVLDFDESSSSSSVLNLLPDSFDSLLLTVAFAAAPTSFALPRLVQPTSLNLLSHILSLPDKPRTIVLPVDLLDVVLEQLHEDQETMDSYGVRLVVVADDERTIDEGVRRAISSGVKAHSWKGIERHGDSKDDVAVARTVGEMEVLIELVGEDEQGSPRHTPLTHLSLTAGISAILSLFPAHKRPGPNSKDSIASVLSLTEPMGLALALGSIWAGSAFKTFGKDNAAGHQNEGENPLVSLNPQSELLGLGRQSLIPMPTVLFLNTPQLSALNSVLQTASQKSWFYSLARRHKLADLADGFIARQGLFERLVWKSVRQSSLGGLTARLRAVVVVGETPSPTLLQSSHIHLSLPVTRLTTSSLSTSPVFVSHFYDLQALPAFPSSTTSSNSTAPQEFSFTPKSSTRAGDVKEKNTVHKEFTIGGGGGGEGKVHSGGPGSNVEVLLKRYDGPEEGDEEEGSKDGGGEVLIRGPGVVAQEAEKDEKRFVNTGLYARTTKNGCFVVG